MCVCTWKLYLIVWMYKWVCLHTFELQRFFYLFFFFNWKKNYHLIIIFLYRCFSSPNGNILLFSPPMSSPFGTCYLVLYIRGQHMLVDTLSVNLLPEGICLSLTCSPVQYVANWSGVCLPSNSALGLWWVSRYSFLTVTFRIKIFVML